MLNRTVILAILAAFILLSLAGIVLGIAILGNPEVVLGYVILLVLVILTAGVYLSD